MEETVGVTGANKPVENERVFAWWDYPVFALLSGLAVLSIWHFATYWVSGGDWVEYPVTFTILSLLLGTKIGIIEAGWFSLPRMRKPIPRVARPGWKVAAVTTFVPGAESLEMLEETVKALVAMEYRHDTWVLDEDDDTSVKALCRRLGATHFSRKNRPEYQAREGHLQAKTRYGNYNSWLREVGFARYEIVAAFDTDHMPDPVFLSEVLGYFEDSKVGYVQAAQAYYNQRASFIARGAAEEDYVACSSVQMAAYAMGVTVIKGSHSTHRVAAFKDVGGFAPHEADDLMTMLLYLACGWSGVYVPKILARGLTPVDWTGYLRQQLRWARSVLDVKFRVYPKVFQRLPPGARICGALHGLYYLQGLWTATGISLMTFMLMCGTVPRVISFAGLPPLAVLIGVLQVCELYRQRFFLDWRNEWGFHWRAAVLRFAKWPFLVWALFEALTNRKVPFRVTMKTDGSVRQRLLLLPHGLVVGVIVSAWAIGMAAGRPIPPLLHLWAAIIVLASCAVILSGEMRFPPPYDRALSGEISKRPAKQKTNET